MTVNEENMSRILSVLSHPLRREILLNLSEKGECSFTDLLNALEIDTGKLSFHIRNLEGFLEQTQDGKYKLSKIGENSVKLLREVETWTGENDIARKTYIPNLATFKERSLAFLIDYFIVVVVSIFITIPNTFSVLTGGGLPLQEINIVFILSLALLWAYTTLLEGFAGQSLGKRVIGLKVVRIDGKKLSYDHVAVRNFGKAFLLPFDLAFGLRLHDDRFMRYFDKFTGTTVIGL